MPMTYVVSRRKVKLDGFYHRDANLAKFDLWARWCLELQELVDQEGLKCHPVRDVLREVVVHYSVTANA